jgi:hypothetical protein
VPGATNREWLTLLLVHASGHRHDRSGSRQVRAFTSHRGVSGSVRALPPCALHAVATRAESLAANGLQVLIGAQFFGVHLMRTSAQRRDGTSGS